MRIALRRVYEEPREVDGLRILVDRIWPRGLSKDNARVDEWIRDVAPSTALRQWFDHDPAKWREFKRRYAAELDEKEQLIRAIRDQAASKVITLLFAARDIRCNNAVALKEYTFRE